MNQTSYIRLDRLFTVDSQIVAYKAGRVTNAKLMATKACFKRLLNL